MFPLTGWLPRACGSLVCASIRKVSAIAAPAPAIPTPLRNFAGLDHESQAVLPLGQSRLSLLLLRACLFRAMDNRECPVKVFIKQKKALTVSTESR